MTCTTYIYNWNNCMICCFTSKEYLVVEEILRLFYLKWRLIKNLIFKKKKKRFNFGGKSITTKCKTLFSIVWFTFYPITFDFWKKRFFLKITKHHFLRFVYFYLITLIGFHLVEFTSGVRATLKPVQRPHGLDL